MKKIVIPAALAAAGLAAVAAAVIHKRKHTEHKEKPYGAWRK